ncbi:predicted protein [Methanosarcina acetivorans C2A]|uniref:Uncharacterized protein n=1 Tax=Methanosarcina acetivorans (strain ATCC 35395 / DSM 2834 / JCM 12185 / C2A) TaxID=188937 RepID=Q8TL12_METAC|nr:predicted protein [Methanosarcina acetivorans C2A]
MVNGVEQFLNPEKTQSFSLNELIAKGENVTPEEKAILESQGYTLKSKSTQVEIVRVYETRTVSGKWIKSEYGYPIYDTKTSYWWEKTGATATNKGISLGPLTVFSAAYEAGYNFGKNTLKPTLQDYGLYDQSRAAVYDLYNRSPVKYIPEPELNATIDVSADTLRIAQGEGIPVTYADGIFTINAQGADYDEYAARLNEIQLNLFNEKKTALENEFSIQKSKRDASIFGTGLTWDEGINTATASVLPKSWTPKEGVLDYANSNHPGSQLLKGLTDAYGNWYNKKVAVAPINVLTEISGEVAIGAAMGAAIKGGMIVLRTGAEAGASVLGTGAEAVGGNIAGKALALGAKGLSYGSRIVEPATNVILTG